jgi:hypothetical protein
MWEYKVVRLANVGWFGGVFDPTSTEEELTKLGAEGWDLVTAFDTNVGGSSSGYVFIFKRARSPGSPA